MTSSVSTAWVPTKAAHQFVQAWKDVAHHFEAQAYFTAPDGTPLLELADGSKRVVGASFAAGKNLFVLPDFQIRGLYLDSGTWTEDGRKFAQSVKVFAVALHKSRQSGDEPEPEWTRNSSFAFGIEAIGAAQIESLRKQQALLEEQIKEIENSIHPVTALRRLLFASGGKLESAVRSAFETLGFKVTTYADDEREIDLILEFEGRRFVGEVEGKDF